MIGSVRWSTQIWAVGLLSTDGQQLRGTPALHLNEPNWIIDGLNELIVDFLSQLGQGVRYSDHLSLTGILF